MAIIAPSLLSADFLHLEQEVEMIVNSAAQWLHLDVMDGSFVPNISFGFPIIEAVKRKTTKVLDVHLMIVEPDKYVKTFAKAGADNLTVHAEACVHLHRIIQMIKEEGMIAGVALNPHTPIHVLENVIHDIDLVCLMSVNPGFGGQRLIPQTIEKIKQLRKMIVSSQSKALIEIDGGVTLDNATKIVEAGADVLVAGSTVFNATSPTQVIEKLASI